MKAATVTSVIVVMLLHYVFFQFAFIVLSVLVTTKVPTDPIVLIAFFLTMLALIALVCRKELRLFKRIIPINHVQIARTLNPLAAVLVLFQLATYGIGKVQTTIHAADAVKIMQETIKGVHLDATKPRPDIYYFVIDSLADVRTLKKEWNYDNREFLDFLKKRNFYIVDKPSSNYDRTELSMGSTLNLQYLTGIRNKYETNSTDSTINIALIRENCAAVLLKQLGYSYLQVLDYPPDYLQFFPRVHWPVAFANLFTLKLLDWTPLRSTSAWFPLIRDLWAEHLIGPMEYVDEAIDSPSPKYAYIHPGIAHGPWVFNVDGTHANIPQGDHKNYLDAVKFSEKLTEDAIDKVLALKTEPKPIIIIQSDHGPYCPSPVEADYVNARMRIVNAYLFPGVKDTHLYPTITPVNSFRVLFNDYFDAKLPLLPDRAFCAPDFQLVPKMHDVTDMIKWDEKPSSSSTAETSKPNSSAVDKSTNNPGSSTIQKSTNKP